MPTEVAQSTARSHGPRIFDWALPLSVFILGALVSTAVFVRTRERARLDRRADFEHRAARLASLAEDSFDTPLEVLRSIPAFFEASELVTRAEFRAFVGHALERYPWIYALEWIPRVPGSARAAFEAAAVADGIAGFQFKQDAPPGPPVKADDRPEYFPLYYMEPVHQVAIGIDEPALPARKLALERARDLGITAITERLKLVQDPPGVASVIAFHPVYRRGERPTDTSARRESLRGLAAAVFRVAPMLQAALRGFDFVQQYDLAIVDKDAQPEALLYESHPGTLAAQAAQATWEHVASVGGRRWAFRVGDHSGYVLASQVGSTALGLGLVLSALCAALVYVLRNTLHLRRQVEAARRLGQYTLGEKLGEGGMGAVYRAHHAILRRPTAIKLLDPGRSNPGTLARFESEVQLTSALSHPNTVVVFDYGHTPNGIFYYAMEYIDGISLQTMVEADGPQAPERVVHILVQICSALAEAHAVGLVHRDIKPSNVMLCNRGGMADFVKVLDFGLAKDLVGGHDPRLSQSATLIGTPLYVAPELVLNQTDIDGRVDLYAVGAVAYFLLTGTPVFTGNTTFEVCAKHLSMPPEPPARRLGRDLPADLEAVVLQCLAKGPDARPASAEALAEILRKLSIGTWDPTRARAWWLERGDAIARRTRAAREAAPAGHHEQTLEIDRRGKPQPER
jgi:CHASE1-domain containing sensor protein